MYDLQVNFPSNFISHGCPT
ncbi:hypothetical protein [Paenibacillus wynnii]